MPLLNRVTLPVVALALLCTALHARCQPGGSRSHLVVIGAKAVAPRPEDPEAVALAGEQVMVRLSGRIDSLKPPVVSFDGEKAALIGGYDGKSDLIVRVPASLTRKEYSVKVTVDDRDLPGTPILSIYPAPSASVTDVLPRTIEPDKPIKVIGSGFLAPRNEIKLRIGKKLDVVEADRVAPDGTWFTATIPRSQFVNATGGSKEIQVTVWDVPASVTGTHTVTLARPLDRDAAIRIALWALAPFAVVLIFIWLLYLFGHFGTKLLSALLIEPENNTYSLSRAQFFWWLALISYCYLFLFFGRGLHEDNWSFPALSSFAYAFLISLGTLVVAQAINATRGVKGAGMKHPSPADLIVNGGVLAPERVQQVVWSVLAGVMFVWITLKTYASSTALPTIPDELLILMGISSAGYLLGKIARRPGPVIRQLSTDEGSVILKVFGANLSRTARVWIDGAEQPQDSVTVIESDPDRPNAYARSLRIRLPDSVTHADWASQRHDIRLVNDDAQKAEWSTIVPHIADVTIPATDGDPAAVEITGENIVIGATVRFDPDQQTFPLLQPAAGLWTAAIPAEVLRRSACCVVTNPTGEWTCVAIQARL